MSQATRLEARVTHAFQRGFRSVVVVLFGLVIPVLLLWQSYGAMASIGSATSHLDLPKLSDLVPRAASAPVNVYDYALGSVVFVETSNRQVMLNKQRMKIAVMHIGFAVISVGLMLMILGIDVGGIDASGASQGGGISVAVKIASTGVLVFVIGASMATIGGILGNDYKSVGIPSFEGSTEERPPPPDTSAAEAQSRRTRFLEAAVDWCKSAYREETQRTQACIDQAAKDLVK